MKQKIQKVVQLPIKFYKNETTLFYVVLGVALYISALTIVYFKYQ